MPSLIKIRSLFLDRFPIRIDQPCSEINILIFARIGKPVLKLPVRSMQRIYKDQRRQDRHILFAHHFLAYHDPKDPR